MTLEGLNSVCAKLQPASSKNNEILEINVLQKLTSHALYHPKSRRVHQPISVQSTIICDSF